MRDHAHAVVHGGSPCARLCPSNDEAGLCIDLQGVQLDVVCPDMESQQDLQPQQAVRAVQSANKGPLLDLLGKLGQPGLQVWGPPSRAA